MTTLSYRLLPVLGSCLVAGLVLTTRGFSEPAAAAPRDWLKTGAISIGLENGYIKSIIDLKSAKGPVDTSLDWAGGNDSKVRFELRFTGLAWKLKPGT